MCIYVNIYTWIILTVLQVFIFCSDICSIYHIHLNADCSIFVRNLKLYTLMHQYTVDVHNNNFDNILSICHLAAIFCDKLSLHCLVLVHNASFCFFYDKYGLFALFWFIVPHFASS